MQFCKIGVDGGLVALKCLLKCGICENSAVNWATERVRSLTIACHNPQLIRIYCIILSLSKMLISSHIFPFIAGKHKRKLHGGNLGE